MKLLNILLEIYKEEYELNLKEGLIKTTNIGKTIELLRKSFNFVYFQEKNTFSAILQKSNKIDLDKFLKYTNNLGWYPSWLSTSSYNGKWNPKVFNYDNSEIYFEAKFDEEVVENTPSILYHITPTQNINKILSIGLVPKSRSKASYHPDRVYLSKDLKNIENLGEKFYQKTGIKDWTILKIDTDVIPGDYLKLYTDPNYKYGYYTLNNIPPHAIEKIKNINF
jgi:hypothetical protein